MITKNDYIKLVQSNYDNIKKIIELNIFTQTPHSANYLIRTPNKKYLLRHFKDNSNRDKIEKICRIISLCRENKARLFHPIKTKYGGYVIRNHRLFVTDFYKGDIFSGKLDEIKDAAKNIAIMHNSLSQVKIPFKYGIYRNYYRMLEDREFRIIENLANKQKDPAFDKKVCKNLEEIKTLTKEIKNRQKTIVKTRLKRQLIHHDLHEKNIIFSNNRVNAIIDFNNMRKGYRTEDVSFASFRLGSYKTKNSKRIQNRIRTFYENYCDKIEMGTYEEKQYDYFLIKKFLERISLILLRKYFYNVDIWANELEANLKFLRLAKSIDNPLT